MLQTGARRLPTETAKLPPANCRLQTAD